MVFPVIGFSASTKAQNLPLTYIERVRGYKSKESKGYQWTGRLSETVDFANGQEQATSYELDAKRAPKA